MLLKTMLNRTPLIHASSSRMFKDGPRRRDGHKSWSWSGQYYSFFLTSPWLQMAKMSLYFKATLTRVPIWFLTSSHCWREMFLTILACEMHRTHMQLDTFWQQCLKLELDWKSWTWMQKEIVIVVWNRQSYEMFRAFDNRQEGRVPNVPSCHVFLLWCLKDSIMGFKPL